MLPGIMEIADNEALACLRILVAIARADGTVHNDERRSLAAALESLQLPGGITVEALLEESIDVDQQLEIVATREAGEQLYRSAYFMAYADGSCTKEEQAILDRIAQVTGVSPEQRVSLEGLFAGHREQSGLFAGAIQPIADPKERAERVQKHALKYAVLTAVLGAFPIPGVAIATDLGVIALQLKMVRDIGGFWGQQVDPKGARSILYSLGLGTGARLAIANLAKLVPGWGSVVGGTTSFASTFALGKVIDKFFASGAKDPAAVAAMREEFEAAKKEGKQVYADRQEAIAESQRSAARTLEGLAADLKAGKISQAEFDERVAQLA